MNETIPQLLKQLSKQEPAALEAQVVFRIRERIRARIRTRIALFGAGSVLGLGALFELGSYLTQALAQSGFSSYVSLVFSGDGAVWKFWKELSMSLFESLPLVGVIGTLAVLAFVIWTAANAVSTARRFGTYVSA